MAELLSDRLYALLMREVGRLEAEGEDNNPENGCHAAAETVPDGEKPRVRRTKNGGAAGFKERADALALLTRTLEKLLELRSLEATSGRDDETETLRLRDEFMRRLRALDARRAGGARLFADGGETATKPAASMTAAARAAKARRRPAGSKRPERGADGR
ncbi:hypothetical protein [Jiella sonneratiae]|uniref:Uncharacterized protein n=1 Tax=Jiella sonneratiae TaxID=2816856 RepID=A0ABS3J5F3_9HYPH|nr:hypothetical protein [Jiella sonneratiae]MBO0904911.1 hypothetical protein [Jiella sonneratiae]